MTISYIYVTMCFCNKRLAAHFHSASMAAVKLTDSDLQPLNNTQLSQRPGEVTVSQRLYCGEYLTRRSLRGAFISALQDVVWRSPGSGLASGLLNFMVETELSSHDTHHRALPGTSTDHIYVIYATILNITPVLS